MFFLGKAFWESSELSKSWHERDGKITVEWRGMPVPQAKPGDS